MSTSRKLTPEQLLDKALNRSMKSWGKVCTLLSKANLPAAVEDRLSQAIADALTDSGIAGVYAPTVKIYASAWEAALQRNNMK